MGTKNPDASSRRGAAIPTHVWIKLEYQKVTSFPPHTRGRPRCETLCSRGPAGDGPTGRAPVALVDSRDPPNPSQPLPTLPKQRGAKTVRRRPGRGRGAKQN